jgi:type IV pilus assembly protein PilB
VALGTEQLIDAALKREMIQRQHLEKLRTQARRARIDLLEMLMVDYRLPKNAFYRAAAEQRGIPYVDFSQMQVDTGLLKKIPSALVKA